MILSRWILGKMRFSNPILAHWKTHDEDRLEWPEKILLQQCFVWCLRISLSISPTTCTSKSFRTPLWLNRYHNVARIFFDWFKSDDQYVCQTTSFTAVKDFFSENPDLPLKFETIFAFRNGKHDYLLSLETPMTSGIFASDMQLDNEEGTVKEKQHYESEDGVLFTLQR